MLDNFNEIVFLFIIGIATIRADVILITIEHLVREVIAARTPVRIPTPPIIIGAKEYKNTCECKHEYHFHFFATRATGGNHGCYQCKICIGFRYSAENSK